jgi:hypothetical protein
MSTNSDMPVRRQLEHLLASGRQMLAVAGEGDWGKATELQADCQRRAHALFEQTISVANAADVAEVIEQLKVMHDEVMRLCNTAREDSMQAIGGLNQGRQAVNEYSSNSR